PSCPRRFTSARTWSAALTTQSPCRGFATSSSFGKTSSRPIPGRSPDPSHVQPLVCPHPAWLCPRDGSDVSSPNEPDGLTRHGFEHRHDGEFHRIASCHPHLSWVDSSAFPVFSCSTTVWNHLTISAISCMRPAVLVKK